MLLQSLDPSGDKVVWINQSELQIWTPCGCHYYCNMNYCGKDCD